MGNVTPIRPRPLSEQLEERARRPFAHNRKILLELAARVRALEAVVHLHGDEEDGQFEIGDAA
jgi:hypothetical protein